jgi:hypothetical protein
MRCRRRHRDTPTWPTAWLPGHGVALTPNLGRPLGSTGCTNSVVALAPEAQPLAARLTLHGCEAGWWHTEVLRVSSDGAWLDGAHWPRERCTRVWAACHCAA